MCAKKKDSEVYLTVDLGVDLAVDLAVDLTVDLAVDLTVEAYTDVDVDPLTLTADVTLAHTRSYYSTLYSPLSPQTVNTQHTH